MFQIAPERRPLHVIAQREVLVRHAKWEDMNVKSLLPPFQRGIDDAPDLVDNRIGHGVAAD